jgi:hypothetical protein
VFVYDGPAPVLNQLSIQQIPIGIRIRFLGIPGQTYHLQRRVRVDSPEWVAVASLTAPSHGVVEYVEAPVTTTVFLRFITE